MPNSGMLIHSLYNAEQSAGAALWLPPRPTRCGYETPRSKSANSLIAAFSRHLDPKEKVDAAYREARRSGKVNRSTKIAYLGTIEWTGAAGAAQKTWGRQLSGSGASKQPFIPYVQSNDIRSGSNSTAPFFTMQKPTCGYFFSQLTDNRKKKIGIPATNLVLWR